MFHRIASLTLLFIFAIGFVAIDVASAEVTATRSDDGVTVEIDGKPFARYVTDFNGTPIVWPIIGPTGKAMTRSHPMAEGPDDERKDHPHHRSLWFTHGDVNGLSYWHRETVKHREFVKVEGGECAVIVARNDWLGKDSKRVCEDERALKFATDGDARWIDFDITFKATAGDVRFGDTKEGCMGVRVPGTMKVDSGKGGRIVNSHGQTDKEAWGKQAPWVDYHGPVDGQAVGIAMMNHPSSFRFPSYWHVRTYGLFAANPFGLRNFKGGGHDGTYVLPAGEEMTLRYRILFHRGDEKSGKVAEAFSTYAEESK